MSATNQPTTFDAKNPTETASHFLKGTVEEAKKLTLPTKMQVAGNLVAVVVITLLTTALIWGADRLFSAVIHLVAPAHFAH